MDNSLEIRGTKQYLAFEKQPSDTPEYMYEDLHLYKRYAIGAAEDLSYGDDVVERVKSAKTANEISRIMNTARANKQWW